MSCGAPLSVIEAYCGCDGSTWPSVASCTSLRFGVRVRDGKAKPDHLPIPEANKHHYIPAAVPSPAPASPRLAPNPAASFARSEGLCWCSSCIGEGGCVFWSFSSGELELSGKLLAAAADLDCYLWFNWPSLRSNFPQNCAGASQLAEIAPLFVWRCNSQADSIFGSP